MQQKNMAFKILAPVKVYVSCCTYTCIHKPRVALFGILAVHTHVSTSHVWLFGMCSKFTQMVAF